ncbi:ferric reductase-like transmembrane domain-containing protein [Microcoleus sp. LEGE 07076]|uniref:ferric reductase-like transmembrane domain-containing protein n=1 Tax=Microcoleus sp. LEGE 07076 TaxID=915322 RepID=UPI001880F479|nr:ferric reductase-like transmembrane domain-containing protein [Microcoleus sp. LEGE 07076]MBE9183356.1 ferric reductase-like transmembrane domain-containing protein [Microcoleus sp. LEGE 07076]
MKGTKLAFEGWSIVGWSAVIVGIMLAVIWLIHGVDETAMRLAIRATARTSCILFLSAFVASSLRRLWPNIFTQWLLKNRRYFGLSMAVSHTYHAIAWTGLWWVTSGASPQFDPLGVLGYVFLFAMTVTSFERSAAWIGQRAWKILHNAGMHYFWLAFTFEFSTKIFKSMLVYLPLTMLLVAAIMIRLVSPRIQRKLVS